MYQPDYFGEIDRLILAGDAASVQKIILSLIILITYVVGGGERVDGVKQDQNGPEDRSTFEM
jgi:hypothetical protein